MKRRQFLLTLALASLAALLGAQSPPPPPTPSETGAKQQEVQDNETPYTQPTNTPSQIIPAMIDHPDPKPTEKAGEATSNNHRDEPSFNWWNALTVTIFTGALAVLALLQYRSMQKQAGYMRDGLQITRESNQIAAKAANAAEDSVKLAKATARTDQRAWVAPIEIQSNVLEGQPFQVRVTFKNTGRTFAKDVGVKLVVQVVEASTIPDVDEAEKDVSIKSMAILSPEGIAYGNKASDNILTKEHVESIRLGHISVYVHGRIEYADVFKCPHWTRFCFKLQTDGKDPGTVSYAAYGTRYNQADEEPCATPTPRATP